jgi:hypothetical protein
MEEASKRITMATISFVNCLLTVNDVVSIAVLSTFRISNGIELRLPGCRSSNNCRRRVPNASRNPILGHRDRPKRPRPLVVDSMGLVTVAENGPCTSPHGSVKTVPIKIQTATAFRFSVTYKNGPLSFPLLSSLFPLQSSPPFLSFLPSTLSFIPSTRVYFDVPKASLLLPFYP